MSVLAKTLAYAGAAILILSLGTVGKLISELPRGSMRTRWYVLTGLIFTFIAGYVSVALTMPVYDDIADLVVPTVFFFGACFVLLVTRLSLQTARDLKRMATLEDENTRDSLTNTFNRRFLDRRLAEETARSHRYGMALSVLLLDVDHFKRINDTLGHQAGDVVLGQLGMLVVNGSRKTDLVARYGGEEFLVVAVNTNLASAAILAERIRVSVEAADLLPGGANGVGSQRRVTVSIGVAMLGGPADTDVALLSRADAAMYRAKREGRNRVALESGA